MSATYATRAEEDAAEATAIVAQIAPIAEMLMGATDGGSGAGALPIEVAALRDDLLRALKPHASLLRVLVWANDTVRHTKALAMVEAGR